MSFSSCGMSSNQAHQYHTEPTACHQRTLNSGHHPLVHWFRQTAEHQVHCKLLFVDPRALSLAAYQATKHIDTTQIPLPVISERSTVITIHRSVGSRRLLSIKYIAMFSSSTPELRSLRHIDPSSTTMPCRTRRLPSRTCYVTERPVNWYANVRLVRILTSGKAYGMIRTRAVHGRTRAYRQALRLSLVQLVRSLIL